MKKKFLAKKSLGQHFLINQNVINRIIDVCQLSKEDIVLEIGPGRGAITSEIISRVGQFIAIEKDDSLAIELQEKFKDLDHVTIIHADVLEYDFSKLPKGIKCIGNLPYNIATKIIEKIIYHRNHFDNLFAMLQLEHGQKFIAKSGDDAYGSLTCFVEYHAKVSKLFNIGRKSFQPPPKVESCFLHFSFQSHVVIPAKAGIQILDPRSELGMTESEKELFRLIRTAFHLRRKKMVNSLASLYDKVKILEAFENIGLEKNIRAEKVSLSQFIELFNCLKLR